MGRFDAYQLGQAVEVGDVPGGDLAAGHQVVECPTDVDHHVTGWLCLLPVTGKLAHQVVDHLCG